MHSASAHSIYPADWVPFHRTCMHSEGKPPPPLRASKQRTANSEHTNSPSELIRRKIQPTPHSRFFCRGAAQPSGLASPAIKPPRMRTRPGVSILSQLPRLHGWRAFVCASHEPLCHTHTHLQAWQTKLQRGIIERGSACIEASCCHCMLVPIPATLLSESGSTNHGPERIGPMRELNLKARVLSEMVEMVAFILGHEWRVSRSFRRCRC